MIVTVQQTRHDVFKYIEGLNSYLPNVSFFEILDKDTIDQEFDCWYGNSIEKSILQGKVLNTNTCKRIGIIGNPNKKYKRQL